MSVTIDAREHATALKAAISAQLGPHDVYDYDDVPGSNGNAGQLPPIYVVLSVERRYNPRLRVTARASTSGWRVSARGVGRTVDEARWALFQVATALNEVSLTVDGKPTSPIQFEADQAPALDDKRYSGLSLWTYSH